MGEPHFLYEADSNVRHGDATRVQNHISVSPECEAQKGQELGAILE